jgi:hypothetical protein
MGRGVRGLVAIAMSMAGLAVFGSGTALAGTLDQQQTSSAPHAQALITNKSGSQTFTAGITGKLDQADLKLHKQGTPPPVVNVEIRSTSAGKPTATVLASSTIPASAVTTDAAGAFASATFATPASVTAGTQYALVAWSTGASANDYAWSDQTTGNPYAGGAEFISSDPVPPGSGWSEFVGVDFAFKTYVTPAAADNTPPETMIGSKKIKGTTAKFTFTSNEPGSSFQCKLDKRKFKPCSSPKKYKHLSSGKHKFKVRAVDAAGNVDASPAKKKFTI